MSRTSVFMGLPLAQTAGSVQTALAALIVAVSRPAPGSAGDRRDATQDTQARAARRCGGGFWVSLVPRTPPADRKSTRLNSSHVAISYAVFCLKKKKNNHRHTPTRR